MVNKWRLCDKVAIHFCSDQSGIFVYVKHTGNILRFPNFLAPLFLLFEQSQQVTLAMLENVTSEITEVNDTDDVINKLLNSYIIE